MAVGACHVIGRCHMGWYLLQLSDQGSWSVAVSHRRSTPPSNNRCLTSHIRNPILFLFQNTFTQSVCRNRPIINSYRNPALEFSVSDPKIIQWGVISLNTPKNKQTLWLVVYEIIVVLLARLGKLQGGVIQTYDTPLYHCHAKSPAIFALHKYIHASSAESDSDIEVGIIDRKVCHFYHECFLSQMSDEVD